MCSQCVWLSQQDHGNMATTPRFSLSTTHTDMVISVTHPAVHSLDAAAWIQLNLNLLYFCLSRRRLHCVTLYMKCLKYLNVSLHNLMRLDDALVTVGHNILPVNSHVVWWNKGFVRAHCGEQRSTNVFKYLPHFFIKLLTVIWLCREWISSLAASKSICTHWYTHVCVYSRKLAYMQALIEAQGCRWWSSSPIVLSE